MILRLLTVFLLGEDSTEKMQQHFNVGYEMIF